ncbi:MAG TPA: glycine zipper 2TM domain-containing protein [Burkholderiales bacterium]
MEQAKRIHPLILAAAVSVMLFSAIGSAALLGWLPSSHGDNASEPASAQVSQATPTPVQATPEPVVEASAQPKPVVRKAAPRPVPVKPVQTVYEPVQVARKAICHDCGVIESVREVAEAGEGSGLGAVIGGVTGGVVGRQFGGGRGKDVMTVVGVVGGGVAGHQIEKRVRATKHYEVTVRFDDGSSQVYRQENANWQVGERIRLVNGQLTHDA